MYQFSKVQQRSSFSFLLLVLVCKKVASCQLGGLIGFMTLTAGLNQLLPQHCKNCRVEYVASVCTSHTVCASITITVVLCVCVSHNVCVTCTHLQHIQHDSFYSEMNTCMVFVYTLRHFLQWLYKMWCIGHGTHHKRSNFSYCMQVIKSERLDTKLSEYDNGSPFKTNTHFNHKM